MSFSLFSVPVDQAYPMSQRPYQLPGFSESTKNKYSNPSSKLIHLFKKDDVNTILKRTLPSNERELTSLYHLCCKNGSVKILRLLTYNYLFDRVVNSTVHPSKNSGLHYACFYGEPEILRKLLELNQIDIEALNAYGETPLQSIRNGRKKMPWKAVQYDECQSLIEEAMSELDIFEGIKNIAWVSH